MTFILLLIFSGVASAQDTTHLDLSGLIVPGAKLILVDSGFSFTEGAAVDRKGNVFFTDQPNNRIWEYGVNGKLSLFMDSAGRSNGMYFDGAGNLVSCADEKDELWSISPDKKVTVLAKDFRGHLFNGPNDLWINRQNGVIYFTDPYYQRPYWTRTKPDLDGMKVYALSKGGDQARVVASTLIKPNGIVGAPDGKTLYVADIQGNKIYKFGINRDGSLTEGKVFVEKGADGITLDERGNLYLAGNGVTVYDTAGNKIAHIPVPAKWTANLCFGGKDKRTLFLTASQYVFTIRMRVKGVE